VLGMVDVELIKKMSERGHSIREISRMTGWSRQTVRKHLAGAAKPPTYTQTRPRPSPVMDPYLDVVKSWLEGDKGAPPKQRHTARRIYDRLVDEYGFTGAEVTSAPSGGEAARQTRRSLCMRIPVETGHSFHVNRAGFGGGFSLRLLPSPSALVFESDVSPPSPQAECLRSLCAAVGCSTSRCIRAWRSRLALACAMALAVDEFGLVEPDGGLGHRVVVRVAGRADRRRDASLGEVLGVADRGVLARRGRSHVCQARNEAASTP